MLNLNIVKFDIWNAIDNSNFSCYEYVEFALINIIMIDINNEFKIEHN